MMRANHLPAASAGIQNFNLAMYDIAEWLFHHGPVVTFG